MKKVICLFLSLISIYLLFIPPVHATEDMNIRTIDLNLEGEDIAVTFFNLSDGEATLIQNETHNILINTGSTKSKEELKALLKIYKVGFIDSLVITHPGKAYTGNLNWVISHYDVKSLLSSDIIESQLKSCKDHDTELCKQISENDNTVLLSHLTMKILDEAANGSLNLLIKYGENHIYYMAFDDDESEEKWSKHRLPQATILKVSCFGLEPSINNDFLVKIDPQVAVIFEKEGRIPSDDLMKKLQIEWMDLYRTSQSGCVTLKMDQETYETLTFKPKDKPNHFNHLLHFIFKMITMNISQ